LRRHRVRTLNYLIHIVYNPFIYIDKLIFIYIMLSQIKAIIASASKKDLESPEFNKYLKQLIIQPRHFCASCYKYREGKMLRDDLWFCLECVAGFNEE